MRRTQLGRFVRLFVFAAGPGIAALSTHVDRLTLAGVIAIGVPALETAFRAAFPTQPAKPPLAQRVVTALTNRLPTAPVPAPTSTLADPAPVAGTSSVPPAWPGPSA